MFHIIYNLGQHLGYNYVVVLPNHGTEIWCTFFLPCSASCIKAHTHPHIYMYIPTHWSSYIIWVNNTHTKIISLLHDRTFLEATITTWAITYIDLPSQTTTAHRISEVDWDDKPKKKKKKTYTTISIPTCRTATHHCDPPIPIIIILLYTHNVIC